MRRIIQILISITLLPSGLIGQTIKDSFAEVSILSSGKWFRIAVISDGVYKIEYSRLKQLGLDNPSCPRIFGNNFGQLSYYNDHIKPDDLKELAVFTSTGDDGTFNDGDYLLFYGQGTGRWIYNPNSKIYSYLQHNYSDTAFYFITSGSSPGKKILVNAEPPQPVNYTSGESDALYVMEQNDENLIKSGREWFRQISSVHIDPGFTEIITTENVRYNLRVAARASVTTSFGLYEENYLRKNIEVSGVNLFDYTGIYAQIADSSGLLQSSSTSPVYDIRFNNSGEAGAHGWLDRITIQARRSNTYSGNIMKFSDGRTVGDSSVTGFSIRNVPPDAMIWEITDPLNIRQVLYYKTANGAEFKSVTDTLKTFIVFSVSNAVTPSIRQKIVPNQNLHASAPADMIIITHPFFKSYAEKLAGIHSNNDGLISQIVTPQQIYNEFSGGITDIVAIRNFLRMKYLRQKGSDHPLRYLLLFGDGSFENRTQPPDNSNFVPTYQSLNSNVVVNSFTSDDFYGLLDEGEGEADGTEDLGIGRLPVSDTAQAGIIVSKIKKYLDPSFMGDWKNVICLAADDEDGNTHMSDAEGLSLVLKNNAPAFNIEKIYLDAFKQVTTVTGQSYPEASKAINDRINSGCLIFNYTGHGNEIGLAAERVVKTEDIKAWKNGGKLPLFITATCEFSRFDDLDINLSTRKMTGKPSAGELVLLNKDGGGIALMSTTRVVYSAPNYNLNKNIFSCAFTRDSGGNTLRFGDIIRIAKNNTGTGPNKRNFTLLGDPALKLAYPFYGAVVTDSINKKSVNEDIDSLKALSVATVSGHISDPFGKLFNSFNGVLSPVVYDKESKIKTLANDGGPSMTFKLRNNILFSGKTLIKDGRFQFSFIVPRNIDYSFGNGKISYYARNNYMDMNGSFSNLIIGGFSKNLMPDITGPEIRLFMNDTLFHNGGLTDSNPFLLAIITDDSGINTAGSGIGHDLTGFLDGEPDKSFVLNSYFKNDFDNYKQGSILYNLVGLTEGPHSLTIKVWDIYNNSSEKTISFNVITAPVFVLRNLKNYPNPFVNETSISLEHNRPGIAFDITVKIFSLDGRIMKIIRSRSDMSGYTLPPVLWDGRDEGGRKVGKGIYPYSVSIITQNRESAMSYGRMIIL